MRFVLATTSFSSYNTLALEHYCEILKCGKQAPLRGRMTLFMFAISQNVDTDMVEFTLATGTDPNARTLLEKTALDIAIIGRCRPAAMVLLKSSKLAMDQWKFERTLDLCMQHGMSGIWEVLAGRASHMPVGDSTLQGKLITCYLEGRPKINIQVGTFGLESMEFLPIHLSRKAKILWSFIAILTSAREVSCS